MSVEDDSSADTPTRTPRGPRSERGWWVAIAALVAGSVTLAILVMTAMTATHAHGPVFATPPDTAPAAYTVGTEGSAATRVLGRASGPPVVLDSAASAVVGPAAAGACRATDGLGDPDVSSGAPWLDTTPYSGVAIWLPAGNQQPCQAARTILTASQGASIAKAVEQASLTPGSYSCPANGGSVVDVYLNYGRRHWEVVRIDLGGCGKVTAPGRDTRYLGAPGLAALGRIPVGWP
jgi:hypothetical protein